MVGVLTGRRATGAGGFRVSVAVGTALAGGPPRRSVRAELPHTALTSGVWRRSVRSDRGAGPWDGVASDRRAGGNDPTSSGDADYVFAMRAASLARLLCEKLPGRP